MTKPFTYLVTHIPSGKKYYGVRFKHGCSPSDLWDKYFTSSKEIKKLILESGLSAFAIEIRKTFDCKEKAREWEHKVLRRLRVYNSDIWLNKTTGKTPSTKGFIYSEESKRKMSESQKGEKNHMFGKSRSQLTREKISKSLKNRIVSTETKHKISVAKKGKPFTGYNSNTAETIEKRRLSCTGKKRTEEQKQKMRDAAKGRKWKICPESGIRIWYKP
jgi:hypothetical protein